MDQTILFQSREDAGARLAEQLSFLHGRADVCVLGLPRGGVPVAAVVAERLCLPLDVFLVRKVGAPWNPELAIGAVASGGFSYLNDEILALLSISRDEAAVLAAQEQQRLAEREALYRRGNPALPLRGKHLLLVDDGVATGASARVALMALRSESPVSLSLAVPVGPPTSIQELQVLSDRVYCLFTPEPFWSVGTWYGEFGQVSDAEVFALLEKNRQERSKATSPSSMGDELVTEQVLW